MGFSCGYSVNMEPVQSKTQSLWTAYLGKIKIPFLKPGKTVKLKSTVYTTKTKIIDLQCLGPGIDVERDPISDTALVQAPAMHIDTKKNELYGLASCLVWSSYFHEREHRKWWTDYFHANVRTYQGDFYQDVLLEFGPGYFHRNGLVVGLSHETVITLLRKICYELYPVDCLHHTVRFMQFMYTTFGEININKLPLVPVIVRVPDLDNAFFKGNCLVIGGGKQGFLPLGSADVICHELGHGVVEALSGLEYRNESGAMNESFADIMGFAGERFIYQHYNQDQDRNNDIFAESDWLIGEDIFLGKRGKLRNMARPEECQQPSSVGGIFWHNYLVDHRDHGGVHINSGVINHLFYLCCTISCNTKATINLFYRLLKQLHPKSSFMNLGHKLLALSKHSPHVQQALQRVKIPVVLFHPGRRTLPSRTRQRFPFPPKRNRYRYPHQQPRIHYTS